MKKKYKEKHVVGAISIDGNFTYCSKRVSPLIELTEENLERFLLALRNKETVSFGKHTLKEYGKPLYSIPHPELNRV